MEIQTTLVLQDRVYQNKRSRSNNASVTSSRLPQNIEMQTTLMLEDRVYVRRCRLPTTCGNSNNYYVTRSRLAKKTIQTTLML